MKKMDELYDVTVSIRFSGKKCSQECFMLRDDLLGEDSHTYFCNYFGEDIHYLKRCQDCQDRFPASKVCE